MSDASETTPAAARTLPSIQFGSADSIDEDRAYIMDILPPLEECKALCRNANNINANIVVIKDGVVSDCFKGSPDEMNNAMFATYALHPQTIPNPVTQAVTRNVPLKVVRVTRIVLSQLTKTADRTAIKAALRACDQRMRIEVLQGIDFGALTPNIELGKALAFQLGQGLALLDGIECYTKADIAAHCPTLAPFLQREQEADWQALNAIRDQFVQHLDDVYVRCDGTLNLFCYISSVKVRTWTPYTMQSRGTIIDLQSERCAAFPYEKFFKLDEVEGWGQDELISLPLLEVAEKMDGSFVTAFRHQDTIRFACKGSFDAEQADRAALISQQYETSALDFDRYHFTFEVIYPTNRFPDGFALVDYGDQEILCLTGVRERHTQRMLDYGEMHEIADAAGFPTPRAYTLSLQEMLAEAAQPGWHNFEGWVANFGGRRVKIKTIGFNHINDMANQVKHGSHRVLRTYVESSQDTWEAHMAWLPDVVRDAIAQEVELFQTHYDNWEAALQSVLEQQDDRDIKAVALYAQKHIHQRYHRPLLRMARDSDYRIALEDVILQMLLAQGQQREPLQWPLYLTKDTNS